LKLAQAKIGRPYLKNKNTKWKGWRYSKSGRAPA
jgi:hypothetical protein